MNNLTKTLAATLAVSLLIFSGCGPAQEDGTFPVSGTITYKGKPLESGYIAFVPDTTQLGAGKAYSCKIVEGKFEGASTPGTKTVQVHSSWETGEMMAMDDGSGMVPKQASLPAKFNEKSQIQVELKSEPNENLTFDLE
ncbi:hypothetical protein AB1K70_24610 [Bremerella sp. JC770]|uniref:hypothetical protein n=1 Tax=Bremerella sp. JC770 TaxID=3232137 RepID=UPI00345B3E51